MDEWEIENVDQQNIDKDRIEIYFTVDQHAFFMDIRRAAGLFVPWNIYHNTNDTCLFCHENERRGRPCEKMYEFKDSLFYRLINFHSIRLDWVFIEYKKREENYHG